MSLTEKEKAIVTNYRDSVAAIETLQTQTNWNIKHCLPGGYLIEKARALTGELFEFERIVNRFPESRTRAVFRSRFALGDSDETIAERFKCDRETINRVINKEMPKGGK
jgi:hypothetical protein